jgi:hypothetical protein
LFVSGCDKGNKKGAVILAVIRSDNLRNGIGHASIDLFREISHNNVTIAIHDKIQNNTRSF